MKHFVFLVLTFSLGFSYSFVSPHAIRRGFCDNECFHLADNKARKEQKDFDRNIFNKCVDACVNNQDYRNLKENKREIIR